MVHIPDLLRAAMVAGLTERGALDRWWREAMLAVPRQVFLPGTIWEQDHTEPSVDDLFPVHRADDPDGWLRRAYADRPVITQVDDGLTNGHRRAGREATSSASMPSVVARMLTALQVEPGMRVLEIGTGTGYHAALLAHHVGAANVTSVEIDPAVADHARAALAATGYGAVTLTTGDGALGHPKGAPFDRIIATATVQQVPYAWVAQTRQGGRVITPWTTPYHPSGLLVLTVHAAGTATGRIGTETSFMQLREQRIPRFRASEIITDVDQEQASALPERVRAPHRFNRRAVVRRPVVALLDDRVRAQRAALRGAAGRTRRLWDEVADAYRWWLDADQPGVHDWHFTITPTGTTITLRAERIDTPR